MNPVTLINEIKGCRYCETCEPPLPHRARPVIQLSQKSQIRLIGQAPGNLVHQSGRPFTDPSGVRLRGWMGISEAEFYNPNFLSITPMGFCFPGYDKNKGDLPPRRECAEQWHDKVNTFFDRPPLTLLVGSYAQKHYLKERMERTLTETVKNWRNYGPDVLPLPHPSWRNNGWIKKHEWFGEVIDHLQERVHIALKAHHLNP